ncbi:FAD-dependent oxidoreductase [Angustibacter luteus]|uniref:FAD-dependent oxidoreductase n=1 Tax=Angustibacter luteus TaxID=658456 RepID=A0ABW1JA60_9ACTN
MTSAPSDAPRRPVLLTVDDDPGVSRAIARDLRRQYGEDYRVVRAESGSEALEALRELASRGESVAVLLADQRMPGMSGVEFLEQAMDLFPRARRVLLTAYADTDAAITAINTVDLDHYLLKPWSPPEELLYPVVEELLATWRASGDAPVDIIRVIGHRWSARSHEVREFLARNGVPYQWIGADDPDGARLLEACGAAATDVPVVLTPGGEPMVSPSVTELADRVGLPTNPATDFYDVVIVGGGPAGLGAAVYAASEGLRTVIVERQATGGQAGQSSRIENYLGFPDGVSGAALTDRARRQAVRFGAEIVTTREVVGLEVVGARRGVRFADGSCLQAHCLVLATGVQYRLLGADGVEQFVGNGVYYGAALTEAADCSGEVVYVVGGANSAGQAAVYLSRFAARVVLVVRAESLVSSMSHYLIEQIAGIDTIEVRTRTAVSGAGGDGHLERVTLRNLDSGELTESPASHLFVFIGAQPLTEWMDGVLSRDERGFVLAGADLMHEGRRPDGWEPKRDPWPLETSVPGIFAAGDVRSTSVKRVASAVGEGALAVTLVHQYLERL